MFWPDSAYQSPLLLGHRGARRYAPENSMNAFELALQHGCDGFEFDVRLTADRRPVICHDPRISRLDVARSNYETLALLRRVTDTPVLHAAHSGAGTAVQMATVLPCLDDVLRRFADRAFLYIELKVPGLEDYLLEALKAYRPKRGFVVASFVPAILLRLREKDSSLPLGLISDSERTLSMWKDLPVNAVMPHQSLVSQELVDTIHFARKRVLAWTVNTERQMRVLSQMGVDAILSDDTQRLCRAFRKAA